ncbi:hypothetical protein [Salipaludibacillus sp. CF4.18]|uniref:hypothetical protein n=1 Tax=Salipaludibacillus sp. CF4.18 TaxID=3373081 RepID=UPI003EE7F400
MADYESSRFRNLSGYQLKIWNVLLFLIPTLGISYILSLYSYFSILIYREQYIGLFLALILTSIYLAVPARSNEKNKKNAPWYDLLLACLGLTVGLYIAIYYPEILTSFGIITLERLLLSVTAIVLILEALRRLFGWILTGIVIFVIAYGLLLHISQVLYKVRGHHLDNY